MKVAVTGAAGRQALAAISDFVEDQSVEKVLLIDVIPEALEVRAQLFNSKKIETKVINILDTKAFAKALDEYDVCLNTTGHVLNMAVMDACLLSKTNYTDLGGLYHWAKEQLKRHEDFEQAGITGIVGAGSAPGISNVFAKYGADRLDTVDTIRILDGIVNRAVTGNKFVPPYSLSTLIDEFTANNFEYKDGKIVELPPFSGEETADFPEPIGKQTLYNMIHSEIATMPICFAKKGVKNVSFKLSVPKLFEDRLRFLIDLGLGGTEPIDVKGTKVAPRDLLVALVEKPVTTVDKKPKKWDDHKDIRVIVSGKKDNKDMTYIIETVIHPYEKWNMQMGPFSVGFPAAVTARLLGGGKIKEKGFFSGEDVIDPQMYFDELAKRGIHVFVQTLEHLS